MSENEKVLRNSIGKKKPLKIIYHGGSQPGTTRKITVTEIESPYILAYCHGEKIEKRYFIDKIEIIYDEKEPINYEPFLDDYECSIDEKCPKCKHKLNLKVIVRQTFFGRFEVFLKKIK